MTVKTSTESRILTNDIYLAAYLLCEGLNPAEVMTSGRRRISFLFVESQEIPRVIHTLFTQGVHRVYRAPPGVPRRGE